MLMRNLGNPIVALMLFVGGCGASSTAPSSTDPSALNPAHFEVMGDVRLSAGSEVRVQFATLDIAPGTAFEPPVSRCQDVLALVREGGVEAFFEGGASEQLGPDDAVRFESTRRGGVRNNGETAARVVIAFTRKAGFGFDSERLSEVEASLQNPPDNDGCAPPDGDENLPNVVRGAEVAPLVIAGGNLRVRILLDAERNGARFGGLSIVEGVPDAVVPEHVHAGANEALFIEAGAGDMRLGDEVIQIRAGSIVLVPDDTPHGLVSDGTTSLRVIQVYGPSGAEQRFRAMAEAGQ